MMFCVIVLSFFFVFIWLSLFVFSFRLSFFVLSVVISFNVFSVFGCNLLIFIVVIVFVETDDSVDVDLESPEFAIVNYFIF